MLQSNTNTLCWKFQSLVCFTRPVCTSLQTLLHILFPLGETKLRENAHKLENNDCEDENEAFEFFQQFLLCCEIYSCIEKLELNPIELMKSKNWYSFSSIQKKFFKALN